MSAIVGQVIKGYELQSEIGAGGFGAVYRAFQPAIGREVAIKIILPEYANNTDFIRRFETEAQLVARLEHLHIVPLYDYWREPDGAFLVMRYYRGGSARILIEQNGPWPMAMAGRLIGQIASALAVAHRSQIIHRDIKPDNILLDDTENFFLADFGIAKDMSGGDINKTGPIIGSPAYFSPEQIRGLAVTPQTDIYSLGVLLYELLTGQHPYEGTNAQGMIFKHLAEPVPALETIRPELPAAIDHIIQRATAKEPEDRYPDVMTMAAAYRQALGSSPDYGEAGETIIIKANTTAPDITPTMGLSIPAPENPYKGLRPFREADTDDFFGREQLIDKLTAHVAENRLLTVIGPSGGGKSSVVQAGLIPRLRRGGIPGSDKWFYVEMHPGTEPLEELETALLRVAVNPPKGLMNQLIENERGLVRALKRTLPDDNSELVLVIDQFEEVFTAVRQEALRQHFFDSLVAAVEEPRSRLRVIITLRADFYDRPLLYPNFGELVRQTTEVVLPLNRTELQRAIVGPAERVGLLVEPELVDSMIKDVGVGTGALPLLQYALTELYERRDGRTLTLAAYREIGGVSGALARRAEELYVDLWEPTKVAAKQVFLRLVNLGEGTEDTRRRVLRTELLSLNPADLDDAVQYVLEQFGKYRLLTFDHNPNTREPTVEVAHEALIREWVRLRNWLASSREDLHLQRRLANAAAEWHNANHDDSYLLSGSRLVQFREWSETTALTLNEQEKAFLDESITADRLAHEEEQARLAREEALEERSRRRLQAFVVLAALAAILGMGLSFIAFNQSTRANRNANTAATAAANAESARAVAERNAVEAQSLALAAGAQQALTNGQSDLAVALALEAAAVEDAPLTSQRVLARAAYNPGTRAVFIGHTNIVQDVTFSPDGERVASASADGTLRLWDVRNGRTLQQFRGHTASVNAVAFHPLGAWILSGSADGTARLWDATTAEVLSEVDLGGAAVLNVAFSPDGIFALLADASGTVHEWDYAGREIVQVYGGHRGPVYSATFSPGGRTMLTASADSSLRVWNAGTAEELRRFFGDEDVRVLSAAFDPNGLTALSGSEDGTIIEWDTRFGQELRRFFGHTAAVTAIAFLPDGDQAVTVSADGTLRVWDKNTSDELLRLRGHTAGITSIALSPDGTVAVTGAEDNTLRLWDLRSGAEVRAFGGGEFYTHIAASQDGATVIVGSREGGVSLWDPTNGDFVVALVQPNEAEPTRLTQFAVNALDIAPDGMQALAATEDGLVIVWNLDTRTVVHRLTDHASGVTGAAFTPDGAAILSASADGTVMLSDAATGEMLTTWPNHIEAPSTLAVLPGGQQALIGTNNGQLVRMDLQSGARTPISAHAGRITEIVISADGSRWLSTSHDGTARLWDGAAETPAQLFALEGHTNEVLGAALADDLQTAITAAADGTLMLWDLQRGRQLQQFSGHQGAVNDVIFTSPQRVVSTSDDGTLRVWRTQDREALIAWTEANRYIPPFTCSQREQYRILPLCDEAATAQ